jgi:hypothetical protein
VPVAPRQHGPGPHPGRIGKATEDDVVAVDAGAPLPAPGTAVGLVPNAARTWAGVSDRIPRTYCLSWGVSDRNTDAWVGTLGRAGRVPESTTRVAIAHAASAMTEMTAAIVAN